MGIRTLKDIGSSYKIPQKVDARIYSLISEDCVIKNAGGEFKANYTEGSLEVTFAANSQAIIDGNAFWLEEDTSITLPASSTFNIALRIDTTQPYGSTGSIVALTDAELKYSSINNEGSAVRDFPLYKITTNGSEITSIVDIRTIRDGDIVKGVTGILPQAIVHATAGMVITARCGDEVVTGTCDDNEQVTLYLTTKGTWTIADTDGNVEVIDVINCGNYDVNFLVTVMGIKFDLTSSLPTGIRTDAAEGLTFEASVGNTAGHSDFDNMPIYNQIEQRVTLSTGDIMNKFYAFYCRRYEDDDYEYWKIADGEMDDFTLHEAFNRSDGIRDYIYAACYETSSNNKSVSGASPTVSQTRATFRNNAKAKGSKWSQMDVATQSMLQMLITIEIGSRDSQSLIGEGYTASSHTGKINTGSCDAVPNRTGRPAGTSNNVGVVWRSMENLWGNVWEFRDGFNVYNGIYYICTNVDLFADDTASNYVALSFTGNTSWSGAYISKMGIDSNYQGIILPIVAGGSSSTYYCDNTYAAAGWRLGVFGGIWIDGLAAGLFKLYWNYASSLSADSVSSRLQYVPLTTNTASLEADA